VHPIARVLAVAYVALAVFGAVVYVAVTTSYVNVTEVQNELPDHVRLAGVALNWTGNTSQAAEVRVFVEVTNPGKIPIGVIVVAYELHMYNPADARSPFDPAELAATLVGPGGFSRNYQSAIPVPPGATVRVESDLTVLPGLRMDYLNNPDTSGRFHAVIWDAHLSYVFSDFLQIENDAIYLDPYYDVAGVLPSGP